MLTRILRWLIGPPAPDNRAREHRGVDLVALDVTRRQRRVARKLAAVTGKTPEELLDYHRADRILGGRR